ncbi:MAG: ROK family glucokinase [Carbonactinosporaceae bacterium]
MALTIGVDVGATKIAAGVVDEDGTVIARARRDTPEADPAACADTVANLVRELAGRHDVTAVGLGAAGFVDEQRSVVLVAPNLGWRDEPLRERVHARLGVPVIVENDANAAAWGEVRFGAGRGQRHVVCITVGTGIGGGVVLEGELYRGRFGIAGEFGHLRVVRDGLRCGCGNKGCWEMYASGSALVREARELAEAGSPLASRLLEMAGGRAEGITGPVVTRAAREGDPAATELLQGLGQWLGEGIASLIAVLDPGCVVIGGGVSEAGELLLAPAREAVQRALTGHGHRPAAGLRLAELGNEAGLVGVADLARRWRGASRPHPGLA